MRETDGGGGGGDGGKYREEEMEREKETTRRLGEKGKEVKCRGFLKV